MATKQSRELWRGQVRIPQPLVDWLKECANENYSSMNAELVSIVARAKRAAKNEDAPAAVTAEAPI